jgi:hypothetical protein
MLDDYRKREWKTIFASGSEMHKDASCNLASLFVELCLVESVGLCRLALKFRRVDKYVASGTFQSELHSKIET